MSSTMWQQGSPAGADDVIHVVPLDDLIEHDVDELGGCVCGVAVEVIPRTGTSDAHMFTHASLDGREQVTG